MYNKFIYFIDDNCGSIRAYLSNVFERKIQQDISPNKLHE